MFKNKKMTEIDTEIKRIAAETGIESSVIMEQVSKIKQEKGLDDLTAMAVWKADPRNSALLGGVIGNVVAKVIGMDYPAPEVGRSWGNVYAFVGFRDEYSLRKFGINEDVASQIVPKFDGVDIVEFKARLMDRKGKDGLLLGRFLDIDSIAKSDAKFPSLKELAEEYGILTVSQISEHVKENVFVKGIVGRHIEKDGVKIGLVISSTGSNPLTVWYRGEMPDVGVETTMFGYISDYNGDVSLRAKGVL